MFPTASDNMSILSIDLGILVGLLVMAQLLDPLRARDRMLFGITTAAFLIFMGSGDGETPCPSWRCRPKAFGRGCSLRSN